MYRSKSYNEDLSERLQNRKYARGFLIALMEGDDGLSLEKALKTTIEQMGIKEFSKMSNIASPNIVRMLKGRVIPTLATMDKFLKPFRLRAKLVATDKAA